MGKGKRAIEISFLETVRKEGLAFVLCAFVTLREIN
jgi:hypothetical protein